MAERTTVDMAKRKLDAVNSYLEELGSTMKLDYQGRNGYRAIDANSGRTISTGMTTKTLNEVARALDEVLYQVVRERKLNPQEIWSVMQVNNSDDGPVPWTNYYGSEEEAKDAVRAEMIECAGDYGESANPDDGDSVENWNVDLYRWTEITEGDNTRQALYCEPLGEVEYFITKTTKGGA